MTQKLLIIERDTKDELQKAIEKQLKDANFIVRSCSVLEQINRIDIDGIENAGFDPDGKTHFEAWMIIDDKSDYLAGFE